MAPLAARRPGGIETTVIQVTDSRLRFVDHFNWIGGEHADSHRHHLSRKGFIVSRHHRLMLAAVLAACTWVGGNAAATAQSSTRGPRYAPRSAPARSYAPARPPAGSGARPSMPQADRSQERPSLAYNGRCAVCLVDGKTWAPGSPQHSVVFDRREYRFPGEAEKNTFLANPDRYVPALNGNSVVEFAHSGNLAAGSTRFGLFYRDRAYFFQNEREKRQFQANPAAYADADLAYRGVSPVSRAAGSPKFATRHGGFRYFFASAQERDQFLREPARYAPQRSVGP